MKITENVHLIRQDFFVTPRVKRYVNIYLITGEHCYLIDSGVFGSEKIIEEYLHSIGRDMSDIKGIFLTHSHPDHVGGAAAIKRITNCKIYAPIIEADWITDIDIQYQERQIPNFYTLLSEGVKVDVPLREGVIVTLEDGLQICAISTPGHSHGSMSYILNNRFAFTGDAIPTAHDLPIFVDYKQTLDSLDRINSLSDVQYICPAWDAVYDKSELKEVIINSKEMLFKLKNAVLQVENECRLYDEQEKLSKIFEQADIMQYAGNPLVIKSIDACKKYLKQIE